ncbi:MAG: YggS family pyridoxal phosphate-dependent enzyme [Microcystaceae cyanobacterium]
MTLIQHIENIKGEIPENVRLIAVSKQVSSELIRQAYATGIRDFAENRLQEALEKQNQLQDLSDIRWHFIGHLQSKKAKKIIDHFQWIHSVDSLKLAFKLNNLAEESSNCPHFCLQVKPLSDPNKYGWHIDELWKDLPDLESLKQIKIKGLMTILPLGLDETEILSAFNLINALKAQINEETSLSLTELSMGMSGDYPLAIKAGTTMVRLGRILFGERR